MKQEKSVWDDAPVIFSYTRAQAIEDGVLVDMTQDELGKLAKEAGFKYPIAMTSTSFRECVALTDAAKKACNDISGRWWDVLWMLRHAIKMQKEDGDTLFFTVHVVRDQITPTETRLKCVCGPGDNGEPVMTIMFDHED